MLQSASGIVLSRRNVGEADAIGRVLFESGTAKDIRVHGIRKSRSRSNLLLEPGSLVRLTYYESEERPGVSAESLQFASLKEGHVIERFGALKDSGYRGLLILSYFLELAEFGSRAGEASELYLLLKGTLEELSRSTDAAGDRFQFTLLSIFFKTRVLKVLGLVGDARACSECGRELGDLALWNLPEVFFSCEQCAPEANSADAHSARIIAAAAGLRFGRFAEYLAGWRTTATDDATLPPWFYHTEERLLRSMEHYQGGPLRAAKQLREQMRL